MADMVPMKQYSILVLFLQRPVGVRRSQNVYISNLKDLGPRGGGYKISGFFLEGGGQENVDFFHILEQFFVWSLDGSLIRILFSFSLSIEMDWFTHPPSHSWRLRLGGMAYQTKPS